MTLTNEYRNAISEVFDVLKHTDDEELDKIPLEIIKYLNINKSNDYISNIDFTKSLVKANLSSKALGILGYIYKEYLCTEEERKEYNKILTRNEKKYQKKLKDNFHGNILFNTKPNYDVKLPTNIKKEGFFEKIINKIKNLFRIKK